MKVLLGFLCALSLTTNGVILAVSCSSENVTNKKIDLPGLILEKDLGKLESDDKQIVEDALLKQNPKLKINEVKLTITAIPKGLEIKKYTVTVEPIENSLVYSGKVEDITFYTEAIYLDDLSSVILEKDLGKLESDDKQIVEDALLKQNSKLKINEVKLTITAIPKGLEIKKYTVTVEPIENSLVYSGKVEDITFYTEAIYLDDLSSVILEKDLGELESDDKQIVEDALLKQNPKLKINEVKLTITAIHKGFEIKKYTVTVEPIENSLVYSGKVEDITFYTEKNYLDDLPGLILEKDLGKLESDDKQIVEDALLKQNPKLKINEVKLTITAIPKGLEIKKYTVTVEPIENSLVYSGKVEDITFYTEKNYLDDLSSVILEKDLGELESDDKQIVEDALLKQNPKLKINEVKLTITAIHKGFEIKKYTVTVEPIENSLVYSGKVEDITFYTEKNYLDDLPGLILEKDLGKLESDDKQIVEDALLKQNPKLKINEVKLTITAIPKGLEIKKYTVTVEPIENSLVYSGKVEDITFYTEKNYIDDLTYYIDIDSEKEISIKGSAPDGTKIVTNIGYDKNGLAYKLPNSIEQVPNSVSKNITSFKNLFRFTKNFNQDISSWDVSNIIDMSYMFAYSSFDSNISIWNVSKVKNMEAMFTGTNFDQTVIDWKVSNVTNMSYMFALNYNFDQDLSKWDVSKVTNTKKMFQNSIFNQNISEWNVSNVTDMSYMFNNSNFNNDISKWNVLNVRNHQGFDENTNWQNEYKPKFKDMSKLN
ncbi:BspA family leucine-rich repeat surface protein [Mesoplasma tabanidae]|uniref:Lipoprotein n=1 Tax=Mesoplasma tabanidae TaxID=219745 RepID=A0A2K8P4B6_9MOLU|nr:BspA family leucine-rich repeat surface protein [Mesoplasma tabanidae]ATZ21594.1 hypothetical protein MTABA_v1c03930 [Mesoplasma tabanidae]